MALFDKIVSLYPQLSSADFHPVSGTIVIQNDSDGRGEYIAQWNHPTLPEPTPEQLGN